MASPSRIKYLPYITLRHYTTIFSTIPQSPPPNTFSSSNKQQGTRQVEREWDDRIPGKPPKSFELWGGKEGMSNIYS